MTNNYSVLGLRNALGLNGQSSTLIGFGYDGASRLASVTNGAMVASYSYLANSPLVEQISFKNSGTTRMTTSKTYDFLNRLTRISSAPSASSAVEFSYSYNPANQRTNVTLGPDGSKWVYAYDKLGQVTSGKKYWKDGTPVAGEQFEYTFDDIGNRLRTKTGGDSSGGNLRVAAYTNNLLNQITGRDVPGTNDILGIAHASATVTVNGQSTYRKGEFYQKALSFTNSAFALYPYVTNKAVMSATESATNRIYLGRTPEVFGCDPDGNLTNDGRWVYIWDGENRLTRMVSKTNNPAEACFALDFAYDAKGRRISKTVSNYTGSVWTRVSQSRFLYDGWNLLAILDSNGSLAQSFISGLDLSGSMQGAGGVGGLLAINDASNGVHCVAYDGNGNVMELIRSTNGAVSATYEYGPFGEVIRSSGSMAKVNPFRFSTKLQDDDTELLYYGYRYYMPKTGKWVNRDPIGEEGGCNLYSFACDNPEGFIDADGRIIIAIVGIVITGLVVADIGFWWYALAPPTDPNPPVSVFPRKDGSLAFAVGKCTILIVNGHGDYNRPHKFTFAPPDPKCGITSFAGFTGCGSASTNEKIPEGNRIPGVPFFVEEVLSDEQESIEAKKRTRAGALATADIICKRSPCCCKQVHVVTVYAPSNDGLTDTLTGRKLMSTEVYDCKTRILKEQ